MTDDIKSLLIDAAKAAGIEIDKSTTNGGGRGNTGFDLLGNAVLDWHNYTVWNPATDDGDSARLRTTMGINVKWYADEVMVFVPTPLTFEERFSDHSGDKNAALRWATLRLAAEIGRRMKDD